MTFPQGKKKVKFMKKIVVPIILAAVLGIGGGVTAVIMNRPTANTEESYSVPPVEDLTATSGKYYLNGNKNSKTWLEITSESLTLNGDNVDDFLKNKAKQQYEHFEDADEAINSLYNDLKLIYCGEKSYFIEFKTDTLYTISVNREADNASFADPMGSRAVFEYYKSENRIHCSLGDFILVEE